jgi:iron complex outermembrane recepter protein
MTPPRTPTLLAAVRHERRRVSSPPFRSALLGLLLPALAATAGAQTAPVSPAPAEETIELSPFLVTTDDDNGYVATSTMAGSRLRTPLADTPAAISEFTAEFLQDINANDVLQAMEYSIGFTEDNTSTNGNPQQFNDINVSSRGVPRSGSARSVSRNYFIWFLNGDNYNTERLSFSRGPNSILFGLGDPGGIINTATKTARLNRTSGELNLRFDSSGSWRGHIDQNQKLNDRLAFRVNLLAENRDTWREVEYYDQIRAHLTLTWQPLKNTTVRAEYERGDIEQVRARPWSGRDRFSGWVNAGRNLYNRATSGNTYPTGVLTISNNPYIVFDSSSGTYMNWQRYGRGAFGPGSGPNKIQDPGVLPWEVVLSGPAATTDFDFDTFSVYFEQRLAPDLFLELAYNEQSSGRNVNQTVLHTEIALFVDPNVTLPTGAPNAGRFYVEGQAQGTVSDLAVENLRASLTYQWDSRNPWLGRHRLLAMASDESVDNDSQRFKEVNATPVFAANPSFNDARNQIRRRTYLDFAGGRRYFDQDPFSPQPVAAINSNGMTGTVTPKLVRDRWRPNRTANLGYLLAGQSSFLTKGRVALTYGWRRDELDQQGFVETLDPVTQEAIAGRLGPMESYSGDTYTYGGVWHVGKGLSLSANFSENFSPQTALDVYERNIGNVRGEGEDFGLKLNLLDGKLSGYIGRFQTSSSNRGRIGSAFNYVAPINRIWEAIEGLSGPREVTSGLQDVEEFESEGYEFEIVGRLSRGLSLQANFAQVEAVLGEVNPILRGYVAEFRPLWQQSAVLVIPSTGGTVGEQIAVVESLVGNDGRQSGQIQENNRKHIGNLFGKYEFRDGPMKGWTFGFGAKYRSKNVLGFYTDGSTIYGDAYWLADALVSYRTKIRNNRVNMSVQLNVSNLFDRDELIFTEANSDGSISDYIFQTPRAASLSVKFTY